ncbi:hypothetical protein [[Enterobacter] lignolyticus]|nr:hypothetical protein [[Enterobacter] lignolyticus]
MLSFHCVPFRLIGLAKVLARANPGLNSFINIVSQMNDEGYVMKCTYIALAFALSMVNAANAESLPESLLHCDSRFFSELYAQQHTLRQVSPMAADNDHHAWFILPGNKSDTVWFTYPIKAGALSIIGYTAQASDLEEMGKYYYWGLVFSESREAVMAALPGANWQKAGEEYFSNPLIKRSSDADWQPNTGAASGIAPAKGSVEKLAMLSEINGKSTLLCSVQGSVTAADLKPIRPDLQGQKK